MASIASFFIFCSGVDRNLLKRTPSDFNKFAGIGATVFFTGIFAWIASAYALYTVFNNMVYAALFGLVWGLMIFNLDRYIVSSLKKKGSIFKDLGMALPRIVLAVIISIVIAKPLELKIFETEINNEIVSMQLESRKNQESLLKSKFDTDLAQIEADMMVYKRELNGLRDNKNTLTADALSEADGSGGSKIRNMGPIYKAKKQAAENAEQLYAQKDAEYAPLLAAKEAQKQSVLQLQQGELTELQKIPLTGLASRLEALSRLTATSEAIKFASLFIMILFIAIETAPLFVKLITEKSPYDFELNKIEVEYEMGHDERTTLRKLQARTKIEYAMKTETHRNMEKIKGENELYSHAMKSELESIKNTTGKLREFLRKGKLIWEE